MKVKKSPACPKCKKQKIKCAHREVIDEVPIARKRKRRGKRTAPSRKKTQDSDTEGSQSNTDEDQAQLSHVASDRPRRAGAGKRKLSDTFNGDATANAPKRAKRAAPVLEKSSNDVGTKQGQQRKKPGPKPRKQLDPSPIVIPDSPETSPSPEEQPSPPRQTPSQFHGNLNASIDMAWHGHMLKTLEKNISNTRQKWRHMLQTIEQVQDEWEETLQSMHATTQFMHEWSKRFVKQNGRV